MTEPRRVTARALAVPAIVAAMVLLVAGCGGSGRPPQTRSATTVATSPSGSTGSKCALKVPTKQVLHGFQGLIFETRYGSMTGDAALRGCWQKIQTPKSLGRPQLDRIRLVDAPGSSSDPNRPKTSVMRVEVRPFDHGGPQGDVTQTSGYRASRAEVYGRFATSGTPAEHWPDPVGSTRWYSWSMYVPPDWAESGEDSHWLDLSQWKGEYTGSPAVALGVKGRALVLDGKRVHVPLVALSRGRWIAVRVGIHFSPSKSVGWVTVSINGRTVLPMTHGATMNTYAKHGQEVVDPIYFKQGIYRSDSWAQTQVAYFGPVKIGTTAASVG
jgi:hypothetical protein